MTNFNGHFIGYGQFENWANAVSILEPVYAALLSEFELGSYSIRHEKVLVLCAKPREETVHYCRIPVAAIQWVGDTALTEIHEQRIERAQQARDIVLGWLQAHGFIMRDAAVAFPRDYKLLDGSAGFLGYDKVRGYFLKEAQEVEA